MGVKRFQLKMTEELLACLQHVDSERRGGAIGVGPLIEEILRKSPKVKAAAETLKIEFQDRPNVGKPKKAI